MTSGRSVSLHHFSTLAENRRLAAELAALARRRLEIFSHELEGGVYDQRPFLEAVKALALRGHHGEIRILVRDASRAVREGHRLIDLAHHFPSNFHVRRIPGEFEEQVEGFLVVDDTGWLRKPLSDHFEGVASLDDPPEARALRARFDEIWEQSEPDPEFRRLHI
ncbi:MAG TPA: hypothetical protein ENK54_05085 [Thiotrichales bacterium]|nr:hypothetical protein [Thiotrichales bacterium]